MVNTSSPPERISIFSFIGTELGSFWSIQTIFNVSLPTSSLHHLSITCGIALYVRPIMSVWPQFSLTPDRLASLSVNKGKKEKVIPSKKYGADLVRFTHAPDSVIYASNTE